MLEVLSGQELQDRALKSGSQESQTSMILGDSGRSGTDRASEDGGERTGERTSERKGRGKDGRYAGCCCIRVRSIW